MKDTSKHQGLRNQLVQLLREKGIHDESVLQAIGRIPRHIFMDSSFEDFAYKDQAFPIAAGQTISQPYTVAFQTQALALKGGEKVLEIGTGSGYQAAVLMEMGVKLYTIERQLELFNFSQNMLRNLNYRFTGKFGDGYKGMPVYAPFDRIIVTAGASQLPKELLRQLAPGGIMVVPVGEKSQKMKLIHKESEKDFRIKDIGAFRFVPMLRERE